MSTELLRRADAHMVKFPHHDLVAALAARIMELEGTLRKIADTKIPEGRLATAVAIGSIIIAARHSTTDRPMGVTAEGE